MKTIFRILLAVALCSIARAQNINVQADATTGLLWRPSTLFSNTTNAAAIKSAAGIPSFSGNALKLLRLNAGETALEFVAAGAGTGTVTGFSVVTANGVSATVANPTTEPAATFTLGAITPSSMISTGAVGGTTGTFTGNVSFGNSALPQTLASIYGDSEQSSGPVRLRIRDSSVGSTFSTTIPWGSIEFYSDDPSGWGDGVRATMGAVSANNLGSTTHIIFLLNNALKFTIGETSIRSTQGIFSESVFDSSLSGEVFRGGSGTGASSRAYATYQGTTAGSAAVNGYVGVNVFTTDGSIELKNGDGAGLSILQTTGAASFTSTVSATQLTSTIATGTAPLVVASTTQVANLNAATAGSATTAATLSTPRAIYGNNFDGSAALTQVIASTYGGTGNGFAKFTGPTTSEKTFTLPDASATVLTSNAAVTVAQGGTGATTLTGIVRGSGTSALTAAELSGDITTSGSNAATLATVNSNVGTFGSATAAATVTVNAKGLVTAASNTTVTPAVGSITGLGTGVGTALAVNIGSAGAVVVQNGALGTPSSGSAANFTAMPKRDVVDAPTFAADAGASDTYAATLSPAITAYVTGTHYRFKANTANTGAASINFNALGAVTIVKVAGGITTALADNDIRAGQWVDVVYDGTNMQMQSTLGNAASGGGGTDIFDFSTLEVLGVFGGSTSITNLPYRSSAVGSGTLTQYVGNDFSAIEIRTGTTSGWGHYWFYSANSGTYNIYDLDETHTWKMQFLIRTGADITDFRLIVGAVAVAGTATPVDGIGVRFDTSLGDSNFRLVAWASSTPTLGSDNLGAVAANTVYTIKIWSTADGTIRATVNGGTESTLTTGITSVRVNPIFQLINSGAADKRAQLSRFALRIEGLSP